METIVVPLPATLMDLLRNRTSLQLEVLALRRNSIYGYRLRHRVKSLGIKEVLKAPRSPWQNPYVERVIGSIRRDCLDHVLVFNERHLRRALRDYFNYYHSCRTHLSLNKDSPKPQTVEPEALGNIVALPPDA